MNQQKVIITCAVTGSVHTPSLSPYLPITPAQIVDGSLAAVEAGAAILHLHARNPETGEPTADPEVFAQFLPEIADRTDAVVNITTGGALGMALEDRLAAAVRFEPEMTSLNMGSMNFCFSALAEKDVEWQHEWEQTYLRGTDDVVFKNTFRDIEQIMKTLGSGLGVRFEFECYDTSHLYNLAYMVERGLYEPPFFIQTIFGILGGTGPAVDHLVHMRQTADRLFGSDYQWSTLAAGPHQMRLDTVAAVMGSHVRVGLEDSLTIGRATLATSNAQQVAKIRRIIEELGMEIATPDEARELLQLKGSAATALR